MSVHSVLILPPNVRFNDVREVLVRLYGADANEPKFEPRFEAPSHCPAWGELFVRTVKRYECQSEPHADRFMWSFEADGWNGERMLRRVSDPWSIQLFKAIADFFGGKVEFEDGDDKIDYEVPFKSRLENNPEDDPHWTLLRNRIEAVRPLVREG